MQTTRSALEQNSPRTLSRIKSLKGQVGGSGSTFRFSKSMIYKMVGQLADFDPNYRGLVEIILDNDELEAIGKVSFANVLNQGKFHTNPAYIDALSQLGGFVMNGNEGVDLDKELFVNHGWESLQLFDTIDPAKTYSTHVKMTEGKDKLWGGDISIFDGDELVGVFHGVAVRSPPTATSFHANIVLSFKGYLNASCSTSSMQRTKETLILRPSNPILRCLLLWLLPFPQPMP